eukprot:SAG22_NODE_9869_length_565_cov_1.223176_1_plen_98_part_10
MPSSITQFGRQRALSPELRHGAAPTYGKAQIVAHEGENMRAMLGPHTAGTGGAGRWYGDHGRGATDVAGRTTVFANGAQLWERPSSSHAGSGPSPEHG